MPMDIKQEHCPSCGSALVKDIHETRFMPYGIAPEQVTIVVVMPLHNCEDCGLLYSAQAGEEAVADAVAQYRRVFGPRQT